MIPKMKAKNTNPLMRKPGKNFNGTPIKSKPQNKEFL